MRWIRKIKQAMDLRTEFVRLSGREQEMIREMRAELKYDDDICRRLK